MNKAILEAALGRALGSGGDFAEIFLEDTEANGMALLDGQLDSASSNRLYGAGVRVFKGTASAYAYTNDLTLSGLLKAADAAAAAVGRQGEDRTVRLCGSIAANRHPVRLLPSQVEARRKAEALALADAAARGVSNEIKQVRAQLMDKTQRVRIVNSEGLDVEDVRVYTRLSIQAVAADACENQTGSEGPGALKGFEFIEGLDVEAVARSAAQSAATMLHAQPCPACVAPVVIDGGFGGVIFHEACGHALEATSVAKGNSVFCGKLGQRIAAECVSAMDDGTLPSAWGSLNIDDEGNPTQRKLLIERGVLRRYMIDRMGARRMGLPSSGSGRRQDYTYAPTSRMTNTFICAGKDAEKEMIATMGDGLYARKMGGGSVNPVTGEFNFAVNEGYWVKDGKIAYPVRGATLIGKGADILMDIDRVGRNLTQGQGVCGSLSGQVPTNVGQPRIRVSKMTIGGR